MTRTLVAFHAHPDDEALLTAGTMARAAAEGHRVVLVARDRRRAGPGRRRTSATTSGGLGSVGWPRPARAPTPSGVAQVEWLGYADSGLTVRCRSTRRARCGSSAHRSRRLQSGWPRSCAPSGRDVLLGYDVNGGYGHRDHVRVHEVARRAAQIAETPRLLEATVPRDTIVRAVRLVSHLYHFPPEFDPTSFERAYLPRSEVTHRVDVRRYAAAKRASMRHHASQARRRRRRPDAGGVPAHPPAALRRRLRTRVVPRPVVPPGLGGAPRHLRGAPMTRRGKRVLQAGVGLLFAARAPRVGAPALREDLVERRLRRPRHGVLDATSRCSSCSCSSGCGATRSPSPGACPA